MITITRRDYTEAERRQISAHFRHRGEKGVPAVATRDYIEKFVAEALDNMFLSVDDATAAGAARAESVAAGEA